MVFVKLILVPVVISLVRIVVSIYTIISWPIYYLLQQPWKKLHIAKHCGARLVAQGKLSESAPTEKQGAEYREYERYAEVPHHPLMDTKTIPEAFALTLKLYPTETFSHGYREILEEEVQLDESSGKPIRIDGKVLRKYKLSDYRWLTLGEVGERVYATGRGFCAMGMKPRDKVAIYAETGINFFTSLIGSTMFGGVVVTLFHTLNDQGMIHALNETEATILVTSFELLERVENYVDKCPHVRLVIYFEGPNKLKEPSLPSDIQLCTYSHLMDVGRSEPNNKIEIPYVSPEEVCLIMYTSGTTGMPKGVVATQSQVKEAAMACGQVVRTVIPEGPSHTYIAYLPQAHILELSIEMFLFVGGVRIGYATPFTLNESALGLMKGQTCDLQLLKPTIMTVVPLVLDRMQKEIFLKLSQRTPFSTDIFNYLIDYKTYWLQKGYQTPIVNWLLCGKIRQQFGDRLRYMIAGGAPLSPKLQSLIRSSLDVTLIQGYGTTETAGGVLCMDFDDISFGRVGAPLNGVRVRLTDWTDGGYFVRDKPNPRGELLIGGKMISMGYYRMEKQTKENFFDDNGYHWFVTGDIGEVHSDGTFQIIDRKKDLVKLANGEFISLGKIEAVLKSNMYVDNICIVANGIVNGVVALVQPNQRCIHQLAIKQFALCKNAKLSEICAYQPLIEAVTKSIVKSGFEQQLKPIELPSLITLCDEEWSPDNNLLTAAMKLKRSNIVQEYATEIERMFAILRKNPSKARVRRPAEV